MAASSPPDVTIPATPRVISPTPTPSESDRAGEDEYFGPVTRSVTRQRVQSRPSPGVSTDRRRTRHDRALSSDGSAVAERRLGLVDGVSGKALRDGNDTAGRDKDDTRIARKDQDLLGVPNGQAGNGHLAPSSSNTWRDISRSPSPLGLIPIHRHWRSVVHRHEIPRKLLHVSIGFVTLYLYARGVHTSTITPYLLSALIPIATIDYLRHRLPALNRIYIRVCGLLMRESEVTGWNGVIWYLLGAWTVLRWFPKDIGIMGVLLLSWCDTAASTIGRAYGRRTPRLRRGKSLAGTVAACVVGALSAWAFYGWLAPLVTASSPSPSASSASSSASSSSQAFMFSGELHLPQPLQQLFFPSPQSWPSILSSSSSSSPTDHGTSAGPGPGPGGVGAGGEKGRGHLTGPLALLVMSLWTGFVGATSEAVDLFGWDDNLTIPVLSGLGLWSFLKVFG